jgi:hypothetical protein
MFSECLVWVGVWDCNLMFKYLQFRPDHGQLSRLAGPWLRPWLYEILEYEKMSKVTEDQYFITAVENEIIFSSKALLRN